MIGKRVGRNHESDGGLRGEMMMGVFVLFVDEVYGI